MPRAVRLANAALAAGALLGLAAFAYSLQVGRTAVGGNLLAYRVASLTGRVPFTTCETVETETSAMRATSLIVAT